MNVLAISPHTDDVELGCGGALVRLLADGHSVKVMAFGTGNPLSGATPKEFEDALKVLGVRSWYLHNYDCRIYGERRQNILRMMIHENRQTKPDLVFVPNTGNMHQDHEVVTAEARRAFRSSSMLGYELPWGDTMPLHTPFYIRLNDDALQKKCDAVACYKTQKERMYTSETFLYSLARVRGVQSGREGFAEAFEVLKWVL